MNDTAIKIENLSKVYRLYDKNIDRLKEAVHPFKKKYHRPFYALKEINLTVKKGEILGIVGRNGSGKSTLVKIISGVLVQSTGNCRINGQVSPLLGVAGGFNPELTGIENIYLNGMIKGYSRREMDARIDKIISFAEIGEFIQQPVKTYSSGMNARLGFAVAINVDPEILILDEVLSVGDELFRRKCFAKMEELFASDCTVLFVSHSMNSIHQICTRTIFLDRGEQILDGPPKLVTMHYLKYLYAKRTNRNALREEIIRLNRDEAKKADFAASIEEAESENPTDADYPMGAIPYNVEREESAQKAYYLPELKPVSTIVSKDFDVDITDIFIKTLSGEKVNALVMNEEYVVHYKVKFNISAENVTSGLGFKTVRGVGISGARIPGRYDYIENVKKGDVFYAEAHFRCSLLPRSYFINVDIKGSIDGEEHRLSHINDALIFKVQDVSDSSSTGLVQLIDYADIKKFQSRKEQ